MAFTRDVSYLAQPFKNSSTPGEGGNSHIKRKGGAHRKF